MARGFDSLTFRKTPPRALRERAEESQTWRRREAQVASGRDYRPQSRCRSGQEIGLLTTPKISVMMAMAVATPQEEIRAQKRMVKNGIHRKPHHLSGLQHAERRR